MKILYSRHARRRMKLYDISQAEIEDVISKGKKTVIEDKASCIFMIHESGYPLKVVYKQIEENLLIITCYPLKRSHTNENQV